jgi:plastocyanin
MTYKFNVTGAASVLALALCSETAEESVTFGFDPLGHNGSFGSPYEPAPALAPGANVHVSVERTFSGVGAHRYHCTIHQRMFGGAAQ